MTDMMFMEFMIDNHLNSQWMPLSNVDNKISTFDSSRLDQAHELGLAQIPEKQPKFLGAE